MAWITRPKRKALSKEEHKEKKKQAEEEKRAQEKRRQDRASAPEQSTTIGKGKAKAPMQEKLSEEEKLSNCRAWFDSWRKRVLGGNPQALAASEEQEQKGFGPTKAHFRLAYGKWDATKHFSDKPLGNEWSTVAR
ncbi:unnamed protein product [Zymoseptoria tritici ST99CH_3D1]|nr:unnamed protein product [Zymoseptoria tritici ST99CH_3D1]